MIINESVVSKTDVASGKVKTLVVVDELKKNSTHKIGNRDHNLLDSTQDNSFH